MSTGSSKPAQPDERKGPSGRVLVLVAAFLLGLWTWLLLRPGAPTLEDSNARGRQAPSIPARVAPHAATFVAAELSERNSVTEVPPTLVPAALVSNTRPKTLVRGALLDAFDAPIQDASSAGVSFVDHNGLRRTSDAKDAGAYELQALEFGSYWVTASADGYRTLEEQFDLQPNRPVLRKDFTLQKAVELRVRVTTPDGQNLFDVLKQTGAPMGTRLLVPIATREPPGKRFDDVVGSLNDKFGVGQFQNQGPRAERLPPGCMGVLLLECDLPVCVSLVYHHVVLQTRRIGRGQDEVNFVLSPDDLLAGLATIRVCIIDAETRQPIERARVMLAGGSYSNEGVSTDPQGSATIERREPGLFDLQAWANGYERTQKPIDALPGEVTDLGTIALEKEVSVEGRVVDLEGHAHAASFSLGIVDPDDRRVHWSRQDAFTSSGDGSFAIRGLGRREYVIRTGNRDPRVDGEWEGISWVSGNLLLDTRGGPLSGLELRLRPASKLVLHATSADGARFRVVDERGLELVEGSLHGSEPRALELPAGSYRVALLDERGATLSQSSIALGSETLELELQR